MNIKTLIFVIIGSVIFIVIWLLSMVGAMALMVGFGFGLWWHDWLKDIYVAINKNIYFEQKSEIENRKRKLELELEKLNQGD